VPNYFAADPQQAALMEPPPFIPSLATTPTRGGNRHAIVAAPSPGIGRSTSNVMPPGPPIAKKVTKKKKNSSPLEQIAAKVITKTIRVERRMRQKKKRGVFTAGGKKLGPTLQVSRPAIFVLLL
jgi:hypothetical protein